MTDPAAVLAAIGEASRDTVRLHSVDSAYVPLWARGSRPAAKPALAPASVTATVTVTAADGSSVSVSVTKTAAR